MKIACMYPGPGDGLYATVEANVKKGLGEDIEFKHFNADYSILFDMINNYGNVMQQKHKDDLTELFGRAIAWGPDAIVCTCSSIGAEADRIAKENPDVKIFRIDYPMARKAVDGYDNIAFLSAKICLEQADAYYVSPAFNGSSTARDQVAALMKKCLVLTSDIDNQIEAAFEEAVEECEYSE